MSRILICEDEDDIREFIVINLKRAGYEVVDVNCGEDALKVFDKFGDTFDVCILDIMMPGIDGFQVCKHIRELSKTVGIIMLSAKSQEMDKVNGLMLGADDYITKPFSPSELTARVDAIQRRVGLSETRRRREAPIISSGPFKIDSKSRTITKNNIPLEMTQVEYKIMEFFIKNKNMAFQRNEILDNIWGKAFVGDEKIIDVNIRRIRMKIEDEPSKPKYLVTVWGYGYKWNDQNNES